MAIFIESNTQIKDLQPTKNDQKILDYLAKTELDYYDELIAEDGNYQVWYQLSSLRTGLISWYPFKKNASVLEIGAGFGALTGMLSEKCCKVAATERSYLRAKAIADRWKDKENLTVYAGEWSEISFDEKFDYIIITGILERVGNGSSQVQVYADYLKKVTALLADGGKILVSVENRYGLRYFCGAVEPHTGRAFDGIHKYPKGTKGYSFSHVELEEIVKRAGFQQSKFYYPLPDYKFPQLIYTDAHLPEVNVRERLIPYYLRKDTLIGDEQGLYDDVVKGGVFPFFANSYMVEIGSTPANVVYAAVSTDRGKEKAFTTSICGDDVVIKKAIFAEGKVSEQQLLSNIKDLVDHQIPVVEHEALADGGVKLPFVSYPTLSNVLKTMIYEKTDKFLEIIDRLYETILQSSEVVCEDATTYASIYLKDEQTSLAEEVACGPILKKAYMELIPLNCFYDEKQDALLYFDQEFVRENYPAKYVLFRAIHYIYCFTPNAERHYPLQKLIEKYEMQSIWSIFQAEERAFLDDVRCHKKYAQFYRWARADRRRIEENVNKLMSQAEVVEQHTITDKMKRVWHVELEMLDEIDRICKKYRLTYFLVHGSLLGAVRHKGFIPWDDDLDVSMPRKDYKKFLEVASKELKEPLSVVTALDEKELFWGPFARMRNSNTTGIEVQNMERKGNQGIWVDILPLDVCPEDDALFQKKSLLVTRAQAVYRYKRLIKEHGKISFTDLKEYFGFFKCFGMYLYALFHDKESIYKKLEHAMTLYNEMNSKDVAYFTGFAKHKPLPSRDFENTLLMDFEGRKIPVPAGYEEYLFVTLGADYMRMPPMEERKPKHRGIMDPDVPYTKYQEMLCDLMGDVKGKNIILFGSGLMFEDYMKKYGDKYRPTFLVDNDETKWGRNRMGIPIKEPAEILKVPEKKRHIIICSYYYREIIPQLEKMGIHDYKVYVQKMEWILETEGKDKK